MNQSHEAYDAALLAGNNTAITVQAIHRDILRSTITFTHAAYPIVFVMKYPHPMPSPYTNAPHPAQAANETIQFLLEEIDSGYMNNRSYRPGETITLEIV